MSQTRQEQVQSQTENLKNGHVYDSSGKNSNSKVSQITVNQTGYVDNEKGQKTFKQMIVSSMWDGINPYPDTQHSYLISNFQLKVLRFVFAIYAGILIFIECYEEENPLSNLKYLTFYGELLCFTYFCLTTVNKYWKLAHLLFEVVFSMQIAICLMYWIAVYPTQNHDGSTYFYIKTISAHGGMFLLIWIDNIFNEIRFYKRHTVFLVLFMVFYLTINIGVTLYDKPVYKPINWKSLACYIYIVIAISMGLFHFFFGVLFYDIFKKHKVEKKKLRRKRSQQSVKYHQEIRTAHKFRRGFF